MIRNEQFITQAGKRKLEQELAEWRDRAARNFPAA
jgi:hypothetical protein